MPTTTVAAVEDDVHHDDVLAWYAGAMAELDAVVAHAEQWVVAVVGPHFAAALVARDAPAEDGADAAGDPVGGHVRRLDYVKSSG